MVAMKHQFIQHPLGSALDNDLDVLRKKLNSALGFPPRPALTAALDLLTRANTALEFLEKRNADIENWAVEAIRQLQADVASSENTVALYRDRVREAEQLNCDLGKKLSAAERRAIQAEERAVKAETELLKERARAGSAEARAAKAEAEASDAEQWLSQVSDLINANLAGAAIVLDNLETSQDPVAALKKKLGA